MLASPAMIADRPPQDEIRSLPTVFGLDPIQLYTRYWAALGVQVVRQGEPSEIVSHAELYLLTEPRPLVLFRLVDLLEGLNWIKPLVIFIRLRDPRQRLPRQRLVTDGHDRFSRFEKLNDVAGESGLCRVGLTPEVEVARLWQSAPDAQTGWRRLRRFTPRHDRLTWSLQARIYDQDRRDELAMFTHDLVKSWRRPDAVVSRLDSAGAECWKDSTAIVEPAATLLGPVWVGSGRTVPQSATIIGPQILWDDPARRPATEPIRWLQIEPTAEASATSPGVTNHFWRNLSRTLRKITRS
jgi:hypothetical protein